MKIKRNANAKYDEPTVIYTERVPISHKAKIKKMVQNYLKPLRVKK